MKMDTSRSGHRNEDLITKLGANWLEAHSEEIDVRKNKISYIEENNCRRINGKDKIICRHGKTMFNTIGRIGWSDSP